MNAARVPRTIPGRSMKGRDGFSFIEILVAMIFLAIVTVSIFSFVTSSGRGTLDAYRETIAYSIALETLEWVAGLGYERLLAAQLAPTPALEQLGTTGFAGMDSVTRDDGGMIAYPDEYRVFERKTELIHLPAEKLILIKVTVQPVAGTTIGRGSIVLEKLVGAEYD